MDYHKEHNKNIILWEKTFRNILLDKNTNVADLCPGDNPKIEQALLGYGFKGKLIVVDASKKRLDILKKKFNKAPLKLVILQEKLQNLSLPPRCHVFGNHLIDDLISYEFCKRRDLDYDLLLTDVDFSRKVWNKIIRNSKDLEVFVIKTLKDIAYKIKPGNYFILSQYPSKFEIENNFSHETKLCLTILNKLVKELVSSERFSDMSHLTYKIFDEINSLKFKPMHWKILLAK